MSTGLGSTFKLTGDLIVQAPLSAFTALGQVGCDIVKQDDGSVKVDFTASGLSTAQVLPYLDPLRGQDGISAVVDPSSNSLICTSTDGTKKPSVLEIGKRVAGLAVAKNDSLGLAFSNYIQKHPKATVIDRSPLVMGMGSF